MAQSWVLRSRATFRTASSSSGGRHTIRPAKIVVTLEPESSRLNFRFFLFGLRGAGAARPAAPTLPTEKVVPASLRPPANSLRSTGSTRKPSVECRLQSLLSAHAILQEQHQQNACFLRRQVVAHHGP